MVRRARDTAAAPIAPRFLSLPDASTYTSYAPKTLRRYISEGKLTAYRATPNGDIRLAIEELDALLGAIAG
jgi:hypothetical protein